MSKRPFPEEDFLCPVCRDVFNDPVVLPCGHSACKECIENCWRMKASRECPLCRKVSFSNPHRSMALKNMCHSYVDYKHQLEEFCDAHREKLSLYCCDDEQLVCERCRDSGEHRNHTCRPAGEVAEEHRVVCQSQLDVERTKMKMTQYACLSFNMKTRHINISAKYMETLIRRDFVKLHQLLNDEERVMIEALGQEKQQKSQAMTEKLQKINEDIVSLSSSIRELEQTLESSDVRFLQTFKDALERVKYTPQYPELSPGELIDRVKYIGNVKFNVWRKIRESISYSPVLLDPNTLNCELKLSDDLTEVGNPNEFLDESEYLAGVPLPDNLERFENYPCVLGSVGFSTGTHSWIVEVEKNNVWVVGVATESVQRKGKYELPRDVWTIGFKHDTLSVRSPLESRIHLSGFEKPKQVRVELNMSDGQVSFTDPQSDVIYFTFTHDFREKVFPFFHTMCEEPLRILSVVKSS